MTPSLAVLSPNSINQLQMTLATFYKKISNHQQSPQEKKIWNRRFPIIRKFSEKNVITLVILHVDMSSVAMDPRIRSAIGSGALSHTSRLAENKILTFSVFIFCMSTMFILNKLGWYSLPQKKYCYWCYLVTPEYFSINSGNVNSDELISLNNTVELDQFAWFK